MSKENMPTNLTTMTPDEALYQEASSTLALINVQEKEDPELDVMKSFGYEPLNQLCQSFDNYIAVFESTEEFEKCKILFDFQKKIKQKLRELESEF